MLSWLCFSNLDQSVRNLAVNKILSIRGSTKLQNVTIDSDVVQSASTEPMKEAVMREVVSNDSIRKSIIPNINVRAKAYHQLVNLNDPDIG